MMSGRIKRNMTDALLDGATDGALKKPAPNWANRVDDVTDSARQFLNSEDGGYDWSAVDPSTRAYCRGYVRGA